MAIIEPATRIDEAVSPQTLVRAELARQLRANQCSWKDVARELGVAESTAIWLAGRYPPEGSVSVRRSILATLGCAGLRTARSGNSTWETSTSPTV